MHNNPVHRHAENPPPPGSPDGGQHSHRVMRKFGSLLGARGVRELLQTVFLVCLARRSTTTYGDFMLALGVGQVLLFAAEFGLDQHLVRRLSREDADIGDVLAQFTVLKGVMFICAWLAMLAFVAWQGYEPSLKRLVAVIATGVGLEAFSSSFFVAFRVQGRQHVEGGIRAASAGLGFGYGLAALFSGAGPLAVAFYAPVEAVVNLGAALAAVLRRGLVRLRMPRRADILATWRVGLVFALIALAGILYNKINIFVLRNFGGAEAVGFYSAAWQIVDGISCLLYGLLLRNVMFPLFVRLSASDVAEVSRLARETARWLLVCAGFFMFLLAVESDRIIGLVYGGEYGDAVWMQRALVPTIPLSLLHNTAAFLMISVKRERLLLVFYLTGLLCNVLCCLLAIPVAPLAGAVLSVVLTKAVMALMTVTYCQVRFGLVTGRAALSVALVVAVGAALYAAGSAALFREAAELLAIAPAAFLAWRWWHASRPRLQP